MGIRVIADERQGFAHAETLDPAVLEETLAEARDNAVYGAPDEFYGLAAPWITAEATGRSFHATFVA